MAARLRDHVDHEANVREARERCCLEHALHDNGRDVLVDLEDDNAGKLFVRIEALPVFALLLQIAVELLNTLHTLRIFDRARGAGGAPIYEDLALHDRHNRRVDHVERILRFGELEIGRRADLAGGAECHQEEDNRHDEEVDHAGEVEARAGRAVASTTDLLLNELERHMVHQASAGLLNRHERLTLKRGIREPIARRSVDRKGDVESRHLFGLVADGERAMSLVNRVDDADDVGVRSVVVGVEDSLVELFVAGVAV